MANTSINNQVLDDVIPLEALETIAYDPAASIDRV